jgi:hypothetical protein
MEDRIRDLKITRLGFGPGVRNKYHAVSGGIGPGYENQGEYSAPPFAELLKQGFPANPARK